MTQWLVPGTIDPRFQFSHVTNYPYGREMEKEIFAQAPPVKPKNLGDDRHKELMSAIKTMAVTQKVEQNVPQAQAIPDNRDWR